MRRRARSHFRDMSLHHRDPKGKWFLLLLFTFSYVPTLFIFFAAFHFLPLHTSLTLFLPLVCCRSVQMEWTVKFEAASAGEREETGAYRQKQKIWPCSHSDRLWRGTARALFFFHAVHVWPSDVIAKWDWERGKLTFQTALKAFELQHQQQQRALILLIRSCWCGATKLSLPFGDSGGCICSCTYKRRGGKKKCTAVHRV